MLRTIRFFSLPMILAATCLPWIVDADDATDSEPQPATAEDKAPTKEAELAIIQTQVATRYEQIEKLLMKLREHEAVNNNQRRSELLEQAFKQSRDRRTHALMEKVRDQLAGGDLANALKGQELTLKDLHSLLELLKLEDPVERIKSERQRIKEYIKEVDRLIRLQRSLRGQNENGADSDQIAKSQGQVADRAGNLDDRIKKDEGQTDGDSEGDSKGDSEGDSKGDSEGDSKGDSEGDSKGNSEGDSKGDSEGDSKGDSEGDSKGDSEGDSKGDSEGDSKGDSEGDSKGDSEGDSKGDSEGDSKGDSEGDSKGDSEGDSKGDSQGDSKGDSSGDSQSDENPVRKRIQAG